MQWYQQDVKETLQKLNTAEHGLSDAEAAARIKQYGPNKFLLEDKISRIKILVHQFTSPLIYILLAAAVVTVFLREFIDTGVIMAVVMLNAVIGYFQEFKAEESIRALKKLLVPKARILRDGKEKEINSEELVPGDIVLIASGGKVPADLKLTHSIELKVDEASLTGESIPVDKKVSVLKEDNLTPGDQTNMAFMGTIVVSGRAKGVIVETGRRKVLGEIAEEVREVTEIKTPLQDKLDRFAKFLGLFVLVFSVFLIGAGTLLGETLADMFMVAVATAVSAIPEGLPVAVTIAMAIGVSRMARRNAIIRQLPAVETLGSTTVICSDKTGTLTKNEMTVKLIYDGEHTYEVTGSGYEPAGELLHEHIPVNRAEMKGLLHVLRIGLLCNETNIYEEDGVYKVDGDPTEGALIVSAMKAGLNAEEEKERFPELAMIPFESERGYMATLHNHKGRHIIYVKGAPEKVFDMCTSGTPNDKSRIKNAVQMANEFAKEGLRVMALAYKEAPHGKEELTHDDIRKGLVYAGLQGMMDPAREETQSAVEGCKHAGIRTVMITGDHAVTAQAVARQVGISTENAQVLTGKELEVMDNEKLFRSVKDVSVYARVSPQHKLRIVQHLLDHNEVVAVTGDGVNDAPALKAAHIGIAMGMKGTDVAKESSDMVIADDNFASIFNAVGEGRVVYDNIKKVTVFLVSCGFGELLAISAAMVMGLPIPYIPAQILWLNLVTNGLQDVALAFEPGEKGIITRPPRDPKESILSRLVIQRTILMGIVLAVGTIYIFMSRLEAGVSLERARTAALTTMVFFQFYQAFNCRSETESVFRMSLMTNPFLLFSMVAAFFAQMAVIYVPALQWIFRTVPLSGSEWLQIAPVTVTVIIAVEVDKWIRRRYGK
jgi:Ca2+-transporting ATPase